MSDFRSSDLALCAYLCFEGYSHSDTVVVNTGRKDGVTDKWVGGRVEMVFSDYDIGGIKKTVEKYRTGKALVEPREFQRKVGWVRGIFLDHLKDARASEAGRGR